MKEFVEESEGITKELSLDDAKDILDSAVERIDKNRIKPPSNLTYSDESQSAILCAIASVLGFGGMACSLLGIYNGILIPFSLLSASILFGYIIYSSYNEYHGDPKNKFRSFIVKMLSTPKMRKKLKERQAEYVKYYKLLEVFRIYVASIKNDLTQQGVFEALNANNENETVHQLDDNGYYRSFLKKDIIPIEESNNQMLENMMKEMSASPIMKKAFSEQIQKLE